MSFGAPNINQIGHNDVEIFHIKVNNIVASLLSVNTLYIWIILLNTCVQLVTIYFVQSTYIFLLLS